MDPGPGLQVPARQGSRTERAGRTGGQHLGPRARVSLEHFTLGIAPWIALDRTILHVCYCFLVLFMPKKSDLRGFWHRIASSAMSALHGECATLLYQIFGLRPPLSAGEISMLFCSLLALSTV